MRGDQQAEGTSPAISVLFYRYAAEVHRFAARRLGDGPAADITADVFRIAIERYESFDSRRGHPRAWLFGIAANLIRGHWRTEERRLRALAREEDGWLLRSIRCFILTMQSMRARNWTE